LYQLNRPRGFSSFFGPVRFASAQLTSSPLFPLLSAASPLADVVMSLCRVTLPSHSAKTSLLPPVHLPAMFHPVASPLEPKLKYWICTTVTGYPPRTAQLSPVLQKDHLKLDNSLYHSTMSLFCLLRSSLVRAPCHRSFTRRRCSFSPLSHAYRPSV
jgi:hypothetical protein